MKKLARSQPLIQDILSFILSLDIDLSKRIEIGQKLSLLLYDKLCLVSSQQENKVCV